MYLTANRIPVSAGFEKPFEERFTNRPSQLKGVPGFIRNLLLRPTGDSNIYVVLTMWESQATFEAWTKSESFAKSHGGPRPPEGMFAGKNVFEAFEVAQLIE